MPPFARTFSRTSSNASILLTLSNDTLSYDTKVDLVLQGYRKDVYQSLTAVAIAHDVAPRAVQWRESGRTSRKAAATGEDSPSTNQEIKDLYNKILCDLDSPELPRCHHKLYRASVKFCTKSHLQRDYIAMFHANRKKKKDDRRLPSKGGIMTWRDVDRLKQAEEAADLEAIRKR